MLNLNQSRQWQQILVDFIRQVINTEKMKGAQNIFKSACSIYLTHGAGPFPILEKQLHQGMYQQLQSLVSQYPNPRALIVFSAHWEEKQWTILDYDSPKLLYDYYGFPSEAYKLEFPAKSTPQLRNVVKQSLLKHGYKLKSNTKRGYDHGVFIPLSIMYPQANIPVIQISILDSLDPQEHYKMGIALRELKNQGFLIIGSGSSVHGGFQDKSSGQKSKDFNEDLSKISNAKYDEKEILGKIKSWRKMRYASIFHPREEHLVPYFINVGAYEGKNFQQQKYVDPFMKLHIRNFIFE